MTGEICTSSRQIELITTALADKLKAISGYDAIIWKIRTGYVVVLYGALAVFLGKDGVRDLSVIINNRALCGAIFIVIFGFSLSAFLVDFGYVRKKLRVVVARDALVDLHTESKALDSSSLPLLHITGEEQPECFPEQAQIRYKQKRNWNLRWIIGPLYMITPILTVFIYTVVKLVQ